MRNVKVYALSLAEKAGRLDAVSAVRAGVASGITTLAVIAPAVNAYAAEGDVSGGSSLLEGEVLAAITNGFSSLAITATAVVSMAVVAGVSVIGLSAAAKYAMKKFKGVLSSAA